MSRTDPEGGVSPVSVAWFAHCREPQRRCTGVAARWRHPGARVGPLRPGIAGRSPCGAGDARLRRKPSQRRSGPTLFFNEMTTLPVIVGGGLILIAGPDAGRKRKAGRQLQGQPSGPPDERPARTTLRGRLDAPALALAWRSEWAPRRSPETNPCFR